MTAIPTYPDLAGKVAVVTGGSRGIGAATARALAADGVRVAVNGRDQQAIDGVVGEVAERVEDELGPVDVLVPFAGGFGGMTPVHEISEEEWHSVIESNLTSTFLTVKSFVPGMIERRGGAIVTMASNAARFLDIKLTASYAAAKAGIAMFTRHVALEVGPHNVRANCVAPATTLSERVQRIMPDERRADIAAMAPLGRLGQPEDTAMATLFLASDAASWLTGVTLDVAGGRIML